jgi:hypothetical protein
MLKSIGIYYVNYAILFAYFRADSFFNYKIKVIRYILCVLSYFKNC